MLIIVYILYFCDDRRAVKHSNTKHNYLQDIAFPDVVFATHKGVSHIIANDSSTVPISSATILEENDAPQLLYTTAA